MIEVIVQERPGNGYYVKLGGKLDSVTVLECAEKLDTIIAGSTGNLVFDLSTLEYISSAGIALIFKARKIIEGSGGQVAVVSLQPQIKKVFDIVKTLPPQSIFSSIQEVDAYLDTIQKKEIGNRNEPQF